jgi:hypothetical protein|eukprot:CAMPEP_0119219564 /NCGR_PEP_ID=MMETSP1327-20130426/23771_1 /TAXON_ID=38833 /ORGANISM="Micromonas pusilla, Strain RCC2306" /LENGTH=128 /DNA_ID=CAMNT_0007217637 /DNA_START=82 /DNA_END=468 /DNA_ORIENTATION=+
MSTTVYASVFAVVAFAALCAWMYVRCSERDRLREERGEPGRWGNLVGRPGGIPTHVDPASLAVFGGGPQMQQPYPPQMQQPYPPQHQQQYPPQHYTQPYPPQPQHVAMGVPVQHQPAPVVHQAHLPRV